MGSTKDMGGILFYLDPL